MISIISHLLFRVAPDTTFSRIDATCTYVQTSVRDPKKIEIQRTRINLWLKRDRFVILQNTHISSLFYIIYQISQEDIVVQIRSDIITITFRKYNLDFHCTFFFFSVSTAIVLELSFRMTESS